jgi:hypothetical protein
MGVNKSNMVITEKNLKKLLDRLNIIKFGSVTLVIQDGL